MKKTRWLLAVLVFAVALGAFALAACDESEQEEGTSYTVTYYDGTTVLKTEEVEEGGYATYWEPEDKDGMEFSNWYVDAGLNRVFDFETEAITADRNLYAGYVTVGAEDTRTWAIVGYGQGDILSSSAWGTLITDIHMLEKTEGENEFTITLDLYEDDEFQFATDTSWMNQRGFGYIPLADRTMTVEGQEVTPFTGGGGIGETADKQSNIIVEYAGNYTFTLTTYPDEDYYDPDVNEGQVSISNFDTITYEYNGPAAELADSYTEYYIKGANITQWGDMYNPDTQMTRVGTTYTLSVYLETDDQVMFTSLVVDRETGESTVGTSYINVSNLDAASESLFTAAGNNMVPAANGLYTFTYDAATETLSVVFDETGTLAEYDYYLDGAIGSSSWGSYPNEGGDYTYAFVKQQDGTYLLENVVLTERDEIVLRGFETGATPSNGGQTVSYNYQYFRGAPGFFEAADAENGNYNILVTQTGTYSITFDPYSKIISHDKHTVYIKGSFVDGWKITDDNGALIDDYRLTETSDGVFEITMTITAEMVADSAMWQAGLQLDTSTGNDGTFVGASSLGDDAADNVNALFRPASGSNLTCTTAGTYRFVYDWESGELNIYAVTE